MAKKVTVVTEKLDNGPICACSQSVGPIKKKFFTNCQIIVNLFSCYKKSDLRLK